MRLIVGYFSLKLVSLQRDFVIKKYSLLKFIDNYWRLNAVMFFFLQVFRYFLKNSNKSAENFIKKNFSARNFYNFLA